MGNQIPHRFFLKDQTPDIFPIIKKVGEIGKLAVSNPAFI